MYLPDVTDWGGNVQGLGPKMFRVERGFPGLRCWDVAESGWLLGQSRKGFEAASFNSFTSPQRFLDGSRDREIHPNTTAYHLQLLFHSVNPPFRRPRNLNSEPT